MAAVEEILQPFSGGFFYKKSKDKAGGRMKVDFAKLKGKVITKDDFAYEEERQGWNRGVEKYPLAIVFCKNEDEIIEAMAFAAREKLPFRIRSGRHHYEGFSNGNDILVIDISLMNKIYINEEERTVTIEGGVRNRELYEAVCGAGYPFPGGGCPTVGVVGFTLGGGWGYSSRLLGLGIDSLLQVELINYKGEKILADKKVNSDLFWALRGCGGGNFGIVTAMKFKLPHKINKATLIIIDYPNLTIDEKVLIFKLWQKEFKSLDIRLNLKTAIYNSMHKGTGIKITGLFYGNEKETMEALKPFKDIGINSDFNLEYTTVLEANRKIQDSHPEYEKYKSSGRFVYDDYSEEEIIKMVDVISDIPKSAEYAAVSFYGLGGVIKEIPKENTSFYYRDAEAIMGFQVLWEEQKYAPENKKWMLEKFRLLKTMTKGSFINFPLKELDSYEDEYYGPFKEKLRKIKEKYDPYNFFDFEQSIRL